jgi:mevalonate kinase
MTSPIADSVMAATHKLVQQAMSGQWQDVPKTVAERRQLLHQLDASASAQDQQWLGALKQAIAESDAAVAKITAAGAGSIAGRAADAGLEAGDKEAHNAVLSSRAGDFSEQTGSTMEWLKGR